MLLTRRLCVRRGIRIPSARPSAHKETIFLINIYRSGQDIKIIYKLNDSVSSLINSDTIIENYRKIIRDTANHPNKNGIVKNAVTKIEELSEPYTFYSVDSIAFSINDKREFSSLLDSIFNYPKERLEKRIINKNRITLDGMKFRFIINNSYAQKVIYIHNPDATSSPMLWQLVHESLDLYRNAKKNSFLNVKRTYGY